MPNALQAAGSQGKKQTAAAPIFTNEFFTGLWTQRNPLRDAATPYLINKFYSGTRFDSLIDGLNVEVSSRLTLRRRCGSSVYNSATFPAIQRFYEFRRNFNNVQSIQVIADTATVVYDATGPSTKTALFTKSSGAGQSYFQSVGNTLYIGNGVDQVKKVEAPGWLANNAELVGNLITDSNGNLEYLTSAGVGNITHFIISGNSVTLTFNNTNFSVTQGMSFTPAGLSTGTYLNGKQLIAQSVIVSGATFLVTALFVHVNVGSTADTGTASTTDVGTPCTTGGSTPSWAGGVGSTTTDGLLVWTNYGNVAFNWAATAPKNAPGINFVSTANGGSNLMGFWVARSQLASVLLVDSNGNFQQNIPHTGASTGNSLPQFSQIGSPSNTVVVQDGSMFWTFCGTIGAPPNTIEVGSIRAAWQASVTIGAGNVFVIVDTNGNAQQVGAAGGVTGGSAPTWNTSVGGTTTDNTMTWTNLGPALALAFFGWKYGYAYESIDGSVSSISPLSPSTNGVLCGVTVAGTGSSDPQVSAVLIFRTLDEGGSLFQLARIPNVANWTYIDQNTDSNLNEFIAAPLAHTNDPPPVGLINLTYHLGRVMGSVGSVLYYSGGPDTATGNGNTAWPPANNILMPAKINRLVPLTNGLLVFTTSDVYYCPNGGPNSDIPVAPVPYMQGKTGGLLGYNALDLVGSTIYFVNSKKMAKQLDIANGEAEIGFPIGDILANGGPLAPAINPASCYVAYHEQDSTDCGLYLCTPGAANNAWRYRLNPTPAPESGSSWSTVAKDAAGFSAVQSIETSTGVHQLLMGPPTATGPILFRDPTTNADHGAAYPAYADIGSLVLAHPGQVALLYFLTTDATIVGSKPAVSVLLNEIGGHSGMLANGIPLPIFTFDPPELGPAQAATIYNNRWWLSGGQEPAICRHLQIEVSWPTENAANELLTYTLFGEHYAEL